MSDTEQALQEKLDRLWERMAESQKSWPSTSFPPPVPEEQVIAFEQHYGVPLPEEFRAVLTQVSDGLGCWAPMATWKVSPRLLAQPFRPTELKSESSGEWDENSDEEYEDWLEKSGQRFCGVMEDAESSITQGTICLRKDEEGGGDFLVVTGDTSGTIWRLRQAVCYWDDSWYVSVDCFASIFDYIEEVW